MSKFQNFLDKILKSKSDNLLSRKIEGIVLEIISTKYEQGENTVSYSELMKYTQTASPYTLESTIKNLSSMNILVSKDANNFTITGKASKEFERRKKNRYRTVFG